ncbi:MAG TPA: hypothetical protein VFD15_00480 [Clostridia bacterium]|nr:hypothetical protein [Clostridia bacterium]
MGKIRGENLGQASREKTTTTAKTEGTATTVKTVKTVVARDGFG